MIVTVDPHSGFCFGVTNAVKTASAALAAGESLYCLGDIVHNAMEVKRLTDLGMKTITHEEFRVLRDAKVLIRAHGEPPETYRIAQSNNIELIDATCPVVFHLQEKIARSFSEMKLVHGQILIYGKEGHAEVNGLQGQTNGEAIVVGSENDLQRIDFTRPVRLFSQTTMSNEGFGRIVELISERVKVENPENGGDFKYFDTICRQVSNRSEQVKAFAKSFDLIVFVSGIKSSNGMFLYETSRRMNPRSYLVERKDDLRREWFSGMNSAGICGATSTPRWLMEEVAEEVRRINRHDDVS